MPTRGDVAAWWGPVTVRGDGRPTTEQREADVVVGVAGRVSLVGEAKWSGSDADLDVLAQVREAAAAVPGTGRSTRLAIFAREGFTDRLERVAEDEGVVLVTAAQMLNGIVA
jgi:hypothetical protein